ncbi:glutamyl-tRNA reductase [Gangjinia marincola]|uniref:Glutamyl-tRNA reductase n=1 Tax=Gangjinia marincola TaxID=578463 RepID=A0ABP3XX14_9FLAO
MQNRKEAGSSIFYVIGLSYKKADEEVRGHFSLSEDAKRNVILQAKEQHIPAALVVSTCNRTEIYGFAQHPYQLIKILCENTVGTVEEFEEVSYVYKNNDAIEHMFNVGTGLDSQILGDFEIISQLKKGFKEAKKHHMTNPFLERLLNAVIQASKRIKNETNLSTGATSVSFASVKYILENVPEVSEKNILLFGTGKIGRNTCDNLVKHIDNKHITLINRTKDKAEALAGKFDITVKDYANLQAEIRQSDVLIVATGAQQPTISKELLYPQKELLILDLSIPKNVANDVAEIPGVTLVHLDDLSRMTDETIENRKEAIPLSRKIISEVKADFDTWLASRKFAPTIKALKTKLETIKDAEVDHQRKKISNFDQDQAEILSSRIIQKITTHFANHLKENSTDAEDSLTLIHKVFQLDHTN